jgi:hypothetical protein
MTKLHYSRWYGYRTNNLVAVAKALMGATGLHLEESHAGAYNGKIFTLYNDDDGHFIVYHHRKHYEDFGTQHPRFENFEILLQWDGARPFPYHDAIMRLADVSSELVDVFVKDQDSNTVLEFRSWDPETQCLVDISDTYRNAEDPE